MKAKWMKGLVGLMLCAIGLQAVAQDFPTLKGDSARTGRNANPALYNPGRSFIEWWRPNGADLLGTAVDVDNLDLTKVFTTGTFLGPASPADWAEAPYIPERYLNVNPSANPAYRYAYSTPSLSSAAPEVPANAADHSTFEWRFTAADLGATPRSYGLYVWLPIGPTVTTNLFATYPQRYYVYEILYGSGQRQVEIVDSYRGGFGWVRLGNGGSLTNKMYKYDGTNPIRIILHNTIVRDAFGRLTETYIPFETPIVYADAALAIPEYGSNTASPIVGDANPGGAADIRTVAAVNRVETDISNGEERTITRGVVSSYGFNGLPQPNNTIWNFSPIEDSELTTYQDNSSAGVAVGAGWTPTVIPAVFRGINFLSAPVVDIAGTEGAVTYSPVLSDGNYEIWAWVPGSGGGLTLSRSVTYEILEGATVTNVVVDQDAAGGWVKLGNRRFTHDSAATNDLRVRVTNLCPASELGRTVYTDMIRYIGTNDLAVNSTPIQAEVQINVPALGGLVNRSVVVVAAENGRLYCVDARGNGDGTTNIYWTYPSTPDPDNTSWTDPNAVAGEDGGVAEMPTGFRTSSALIERIGGIDYLFISATNGRVYCIEMAGRGDMDLTLRKPGTTRRKWTFPDDYPAPVLNGNLGESFGSVAFATTSAGPTLIVPTSQGRVYALDADGNPNKTTNVRWAYPPVSQPTLGACEMTPICEFNSVYVGFRRDTSGVARFLCLEDDTGIVRWEFTGTTLWGTGAPAPFIAAGDWISGPCMIEAGELSGGMPNTVVAANENGWITAFDSANGNVLWTTNELQANVLGNLTYSRQSVYNTTGVYQQFPVVLVPTSDGRFASLFAETAVNNIFGNGARLAWFYDTQTSTPMETSMAVGRNFLYGADPNGFLYAFDDSPGDVYGGAYSPPGQQGVPPNDPIATAYRNAKIKFVNRAMYERLRLPETDPAFPEYTQAIAAASAINRSAFEWGETIYAMVYDMPANYNNDPSLRRTQVDYRFATEGVAIRNLQVAAKRFQIVGAGNPPTDPVSGMRLDGVAILSFAIQGNGVNALPPGPGTIGFGLSVQFNAGQGLQAVAVNPATSTTPFSVANPIGVAVQFNNAGIPLANYSLAYTTDPADPEAQMNGSLPLAATAKREELLLTTPGQTPHGQSGNSVFAVYDRSLMTLLRGPGRGLDLVRVQRTDLTWQGGIGAIYKPLNPLAYPSFEDLPTQFPNVSVDYPDIRRDNFTITKEKFGAAENPVQQAISLAAPNVPDISNPIVRTLNSTRMDFDVNVPRFQPANMTQVLNSANTNETAGYYGRMTIYVDGSGNGTFDRRGRPEAYRQIWLGSGVPRDEKLSVGKTELDLGSLAQGTGFSPIAPWIPASIYSPWSGAYTQLFKTFQVYNEGNVNLVNVRLAKATDTGGTPLSWGLFAPGNNDRSWIDTQFNLWSDIDRRFALNNLSGSNNVIIQKARVGDRVPNELLTNPIRRANPYLNVLQSSLLANPAPASPRLSVTIPLGTPIGTYLTDLRVIEDDTNNESLSFSGSTPIEPYSDPTLTLRFNVRETRLTNGFTQNAAPMVHGGLAGTETFLHRNAQPAAMRDLNGQLILAFSSNSLAFNNAQPTSASVSDEWRIFISSVNGNLPSSTTFGQNPLKDLMDFGNTGARWFRQEVGPFPTIPATDPSLFGPTAIVATAKFGSPAFAQLGGISPFTGSNTDPYMAFVGEAQVQGASGREFVSNVFLTRLQIATDGAITISGNPIPVPSDLQLAKARPAVVQSGNEATVFYTATGAGQSAAYYAHFDGNTMSRPVQLQLGSGFENIGSLSAHGRLYQGAAIAGLGLNPGQSIIDVLFTAKLKGRVNRETFIGRLRSNADGTPTNVPGGRSPIVPFQQIVDEAMTPETEAGLYRARGVSWPVSATVLVEQSVNGVQTSMIDPATRTVDAETGLITFDGRLGGKVYVDTTQGTVRFAGVAPNRRAQVLLTYSPRFIRISAVSSSNYSGPSLMIDQRFISQYDYWATSTGAGIAVGEQVRPTRYIATYNRAAAGTGETTRPYMQTLRLGIQLVNPLTGKPIALHTQPNGSVTGLSISGNTSYFQIDPANGKIYFTDADENRVIRVNSFTGVDETTGAAINFTPNQDIAVSLISEARESPISIEGAINESQLTSFIDPFDGATDPLRRPGLIWMFWTSTRGGSPDVYMQSVAPNLEPKPRRQGGN